MAQPFGRETYRVILSAAKNLVVSIINLADADVSLPRRDRPVAQQDTLIPSPLVGVEDPQTGPYGRLGGINGEGAW